MSFGKALRAGALGVSAACAFAVLAACTSSNGPGTGHGSGSSASGSPVVSSSGSATASSGASSPAASSTSSSTSKSPHASKSATPTGTLSTVAPVKVRTKSPVPFKSPAHYGSGVTARVVHIAHGTETDTGPGVMTGQPTITFTLSMHNGSSKRVDLDTVQVTAVYGADKNPASPANQSSTKPFSGSVAPGKSQQATYSFAIPTSSQKQVTVYVWYKEHEPTVAFSGDAS